MNASTVLGLVEHIEEAREALPQGGRCCLLDCKSFETSLHSL